MVDIRLGIFLLFCWNLMARCVSVSGIMFDHIGWEGDAMTIIFYEHCAPKHIYANPQNPAMEQRDIALQLL
jgi:hypothetical protein